MRADTPSPHAAGLLPRLLAAVVGFSGHHPWLVLAGTLLSCALCLGYTATRLTYQTHRNDLISQNKDYYRRWMQYVGEFGDDDDMVVVVQGRDRAQMRHALDAIASDLAKQPELFDRLFYKVDLRPLRDRALLFLPVDQIRQVQESLENMSLLLEPPVLGGIDPYFGWRSLSVQQLMKEGERRARAWNREKPSAEAEAFLRQLDGICRGAADYVQSPVGYRSPWRSILPAAPAGAADRLDEPQYFFSEDGELAFLLVRPVKAAQDEGNFTAAQKSIAALQTLLEAVRARYPKLELGLTGLPVLENDEMVASRDGSSRASWLALLGVALLYLVVYRGWRYPFMTVSALLVGTIWALGWVTLTVGHLNILSSAFAVMLIGMGDYGVLWVTRFDQEKLGTAEIGAALRGTAFGVGPSIVTAALTTALAFYAAMLADLKAVAELGWIAGCGVLFCALACLLLIPALLTLIGRRQGADAPLLLSLSAHRADRRRWLPGLLRRPRLVVACSALVTLALGIAAVFSRYDANLLNMQAQHLESVQWEHRLIEHTAGSSWHALSWTATPEEALALKARYEKLPEVSQVVEVASLLPREQERKLEGLRDIRQRLRRLPPRGQAIAHELPSLDDVTRAGKRLQDALARLEKDAPVAVALKASVQRLLDMPATPATAVALQHFEQQMVGDLAEDLHRLHDVSTPRPIQVADLPASLRERYLGKSGKFLLRVFGKDCLWNFGPLAHFVEQIRTVDPDATGKPFTTLEGLRAMKSGFLWAGVYALAAMVLVLLLDFGKLKHTLIALLPLAMGMIATLGIMTLCGADLNPANLIGFPLILGVGADNGVHVLHDYRGRPRGRRYALVHAIGRGIMVSSLTTVLGFGTLMVAQHRGLASLGLVLTLGVCCCMFTALVFLPALLTLMGKKRQRPLPATKQRAA